MGKPNKSIVRLSAALRGLSVFIARLPAALRGPNKSIARLSAALRGPSVFIARLPAALHGLKAQQVQSPGQRPGCHVHIPYAL